MRYQQRIITLTDEILEKLPEDVKDLMQEHIQNVYGIVDTKEDWTKQLKKANVQGEISLEDSPEYQNLKKENEELMSFKDGVEQKEFKATVINAMKEKSIKLDRRDALYELGKFTKDMTEEQIAEIIDDGLKKFPEWKITTSAPEDINKHINFGTDGELGDDIAVETDLLF